MSFEPAELPSDVTSLLERDERAERCPPDPTYAELVLERILGEEIEDVLHAAAQARWTKANTYSYDAARKSIEAWLLACGWRIRAAAGAHAAVGEVAHAWLRPDAQAGPRIAASFAASRKARHDDEYPSPRSVHRTDRELRALVLDNVRLVNRVRLVCGLAAEEAIVPTEDVLDQRPERREA
jgi:hypothetical protein